METKRIKLKCSHSVSRVHKHAPVGRRHLLRSASFTSPSVIVGCRRHQRQTAAAATNPKKGATISQLRTTSTDKQFWGSMTNAGAVPHPGIPQKAEKVWETIHQRLKPWTSAIRCSLLLSSFDLYNFYVTKFLNWFLVDELIPSNLSQSRVCFWAARLCGIFHCMCVIAFTVQSYTICIHGV